MTHIRLLVCFLGLSMVTASTGYANCNIEGSAIRKMPMPDCQEFVRQRFASADYGCGIHAVQVKAEAVDILPGIEGIDARFALRELALELTRNPEYPPEERVKLLQAATITAIDGEAARKKEELQADSSMLWWGANLFQTQKNTSASLDTLALAIRQDQRRPEADRSIHDYYNWGGGSVVFSDGLPLGHNEAKNHLGQIVAIANLLKTDTTLKSLQSSMAFLAFYDVPIWEKEIDHKIILERANQLLALVEALSNATCNRCNCGHDWRWRPLIRAGLAFHLAGKTEEAKKHVDRAIQIAKNQEEPNSRLCQYNSLLSELLGADYISSYDKKTIWSLIAEIEQLANSLDTGIAKDVRHSLPESIERFTIWNKRRNTH